MSPSADNPFVKYVDLLRSDDGSAQVLKNLVCHFYNSRDYQVDLKCLLRDTDERHRAAAFAFLHWYALGTDDPLFLEVARTLVAASRPPTLITKPSLQPEQQDSSDAPAT